MKIKKFLTLLGFTLISLKLSPWAQASLNVGTGFSSYTSGQLVPALMLQIGGSNWSVDATATGYSSQYDYLSGFSTSYYVPHKMGTLLGLNFELGFGGGIYYSQRGYRLYKTKTADTKSDFGLGPAFYAQWNLGPWSFVRLQSLLGVGSTNNVALFFQDVSQLSVGLSW
jgi:hypothetical protein